MNKPSFPVRPPAGNVFTRGSTGVTQLEGLPVPPMNTLSLVPQQPGPSSLLQLQGKYPVSTRARVQIETLYARWKSAHTESASEVGNLMFLYAPDAQIFQRPDSKISFDGLRTLAIEMRNAGFYSSVTDEQPPKWGQNKRGDQVEMLCAHRYGHDNDTFVSGQRRLMWKQIGGDWKIGRDDFPPAYRPSTEIKNARIN